MQDNSKVVIDNISKYNRLMPESDHHALCFDIHKPISREGYSENFMPRIEDMIARNGEVRLLLYYSAYQGWEVAAALLDMGAITTYGPKMTKFALVNPPKKEIMQFTVKKSLIKGEMRVFNADQLAEAVAWIKN